MAFVITATVKGSEAEEAGADICCQKLDEAGDGMT